jgi:hypothetical protein
MAVCYQNSGMGRSARSDMGKELRKIPGRFPIHDASQYALKTFAVKSNLKMSLQQPTFRA